MEIPERTFSVRHDRQSKNSFVRLHPSTAQALWKDALIAESLVGTTRSPSAACWRVTEEQGLSVHVASGIEFLPLEIRNESDDRVVYASYNGGDADDGKFHVAIIAYP